MKLKIIVLMLVGAAGMGASYAFASGGGPHGQNTHCRRTLVSGTVSAPQSFTVTVTRGWRRHNAPSGKTLSVSLGASGQTVRFSGVGCVGSDGTFTVRSAVLNAVNPRGGNGNGNGNGGGNGGTTTTDNGGTTTTDHGGTTTTGDGGTTTTQDGGTTTTGDGGTTTTQDGGTTTTGDGGTTTTTPQF